MDSLKFKATDYREKNEQMIERKIDIVQSAVEFHESRMVFFLSERKRETK